MISDLYIILFLTLWSILSIFFVLHAIKLRRPHINRINDVEDDLSDNFAELFSIGKTIKFLDSFKKTSKSLQDDYSSYAKSATNLAFFSEILKSYQSILINFSSCIVILIGIYLLNKNHQLTIGDFVVIYTFSNIFMSSVIVLTEGYKEFDQFKVDKFRLDQIIDIPNTRESISSIIYTSKYRAVVVINPFVYYMNDNKKLKNKEKIYIDYGKKVAIIGESGEGKTTLLKIISGIVNLENTIFINEIDMHTMNASDIAKNIGMSFQSPDFASGKIEHALFLDSIPFDKNRFTLGLEHMKISSLKEKLLDDHININKFSGGEKKRLDILRQNELPCPVMVFDEPTSSIDVQISKHVWDYIFLLNKNRSLVCVTHDFSYLENFNIIIQVKNGNIECIKNS